MHLFLFSACILFQTLFFWQRDDVLLKRFQLYESKTNLTTAIIPTHRFCLNILLQYFCNSCIDPRVNYQSHTRGNFDFTVTKDLESETSCRRLYPTIVELTTVTVIVGRNRRRQWRSSTIKPLLEMSGNLAHLQTNSSHVLVSHTQIALPYLYQTKKIHTSSVFYVLFRAHSSTQYNRYSHSLIKPLIFIIIGWLDRKIRKE